jgi:hypothetical protein
VIITPTLDSLLSGREHSVLPIGSVVSESRTNLIFSTLTDAFFTMAEKNAGGGGVGVRVARFFLAQHTYQSGEKYTKYVTIK